MEAARDTSSKALRINLDPAPYGTFAEIGAGQEVSRWFFHVGGAAGTVAKTLCAYDKTVSDAVYGRSERYISRERLVAMLDHEAKQLLERLDASRGESTAFFVLADTVATRSHQGGNECHGWIGVRFQHAPRSPMNEILLHVSLRGATAILQQQALGVLGVNLLHGAIYQRASPDELLGALMDNLSISDLEVDVVEARGPALASFGDAKGMAVAILERGISNAVLFNERGEMDQPSSVVRKRGIVLLRSSLERENPELESMLAAGCSMLKAEAPELEHPPLPVLEFSLNSVLGSEHRDRAWTVEHARAAIKPDRATMLTRWAETYEISSYLRRYSSEPLRLLTGLDTVVQVLRHHFYQRIDGGVLEGLGRLLARNVRVYVFPMPQAVLRTRLELYDTDLEAVRFPDKPLLTLTDLSLAPPMGSLLQYLRETGWVTQVEPTPR
jgi:hypothetical protein